MPTETFLCGPCCCQCVNVDGLYNTGRGLAICTTDPNWSAEVVDPDAPTVSTAWLLDGDDSQWIHLTDCQAESSEECDGSEFYDYELDFTCSDDEGAKICGRAMADDEYEIFLNGVSVDPGPGHFTFWTPFEITTNFVTGANTLKFRVKDTACEVTGLRVEFTCPEPAPAPMMLLTTEIQNVAEINKVAPSPRPRGLKVKASKSRPACIHRGDVLRSILCDRCGGKVKLKVFECKSLDVLAHCTVGKAQPGLACCNNCPMHSTGFPPGNGPSTIAQ